jgi:hypothetical protein
MLAKKPSAQKIFTYIIFLGWLWPLGQPIPARAGCGCDKPPPKPAAVIPSVAFPEMSVTLFDASLQPGQPWRVTFQNGSTTATVQATVVKKRDISDPSGHTFTPQLVITVPNIPAGPTTILAAMSNIASFTVPEESFTIIGKPLMVSEQTANYTVTNYTTAVDREGISYISIGGLNHVCQAMEFSGFLKKDPLRFVQGDVIIWNAQGYLIDTLGTGSANHFAIEPSNNKDSYELDYFRHSFEQYCLDHQPGGPLEVDPKDPNWHLNGTPHVDYSTIIFAIASHFDDGSLPATGSASFDLHVKTEIVKDNKVQQYQEEDIKDH